MFVKVVLQMECAFVSFFDGYKILGCVFYNQGNNDMFVEILSIDHYLPLLGLKMYLFSRIFSESNYFLSLCPLTDV
jgi:hypothetical protein